MKILYNFVADSIYAKKLCSGLSHSEVRFWSSLSRCCLTPSSTVYAYSRLKTANADIVQFWLIVLTDSIGIPVDTANMLLGSQLMTKFIKSSRCCTRPTPVSARNWYNTSNRSARHAKQMSFIASFVAKLNLLKEVQWNKKNTITEQRAPCWSEIADFEPIIAPSASAVLPSKKLQLTLVPYALSNDPKMIIVRCP